MILQRDFSYGQHMSDSTNQSRRPIALFVNSFGGGGAEKIAVMHANGFLAAGNDVDILVERDEGAYRSMLEPGVRVINLGGTSPLNLLAALLRYLRHTPPRAIITHLEKPSLLAIVAGLLTRYRKIIPALHVDLDSYAKIDHQLRRTLLRYLIGFFYRLAPRIISVSNGCRDSLTPLLGQKYAPRCITVYNGFELEKLRAASHEPVDFHVLKNKTKPVVISVGRFSEQKNFPLLIRAFAEVRREHDAALIILGEGHLRSDLTELVSALGLKDDVHMPGFQANPLAWVNKADAYVLSSKSEGLANVLIEALIAGTQVISTDCPSGPREILMDGKYGTIVPVDDVTAMANAIKRVLTTGKASPSTQEEIQAFLDNTFSYDRMIKGYLAVVNEVESSPP